MVFSLVLLTPSSATSACRTVTSSIRDKRALIHNMEEEISNLTKVIIDISSKETFRRYLDTLEFPVIIVLS